MNYIEQSCYLKNVIGNENDIIMPYILLKKLTNFLFLD